MLKWRNLTDTILSDEFSATIVDKTDYQVLPYVMKRRLHL